MLLLLHRKLFRVEPWLSRGWEWEVGEGAWGIKHLRGS